MANLQTKVVKVAQPVFCVSVAVAAAVVSLSNIVMVGPNTDLTCLLRPWLLNVFFDVMFGSLFPKTFLVYKIFGNKTLSKLKISTKDIIKTHGSIIMIDVALLAMGCFTSGMKQVEIENELSTYWTYTTQECQAADTWAFGTTFFKVLMVLGGVYLNYVTRNVPDKFAESKWIALSIYQVFVLGLVGLLVQATSHKP